MTNLTSNVTTKKTEVKTEIVDSATTIEIDNTSRFAKYDLFKIG